MAKSLVAILGRPNVGKSTLFNRLLGRRISIVEDLPGTTRDRLYADMEWAGRNFTLADTGGLETDPEAEMSKKVQEQVRAALEEADVLILLVDARDGVTQMDLEIAEMLRRSQKPLLLAANKAESPRLREEAFQFHELGLGEPIPLSALHGLGIGELMDALLDRLPPSPPEAEVEAIKVAIVGRPNVGKSMLLNALLGQERAIISETPGTTRDTIDTILEVEGECFLLIDTAGIRRRGRIEGGVERYGVLRALRAIDRADIALLLLDASEKMTAQDLHIAGHIHDSHKGMVLVVNKWDLVAGGEQSREAYTREIRKRLDFMPYVPILFLSAKYGEGVAQVLPLVNRIQGERWRRIPTAQLNEALGRILLAHSPPSQRGRRLKIFYATQVGVNPPSFVFFVNDAHLLHFSYQRYLENRLREAFGFAGTPLRLIFRSRGEQEK